MVTTFYPPYNFGGDGIFVQQLARDLVQAGHEVHVVHCTDAWRVLAGRREPENRDEASDGVVVHRLSSRFGRLSPLITQQTGRPGLKRPQLERILAGEFDVINFHNVSLVGGPGVLGMGTATRVFTLHEHWWVCPTHILYKYTGELCEERACLRCTLAHRTPPQLWRASQSWMGRCLSKVDLIVSPSEFTASRHRDWMREVGVDVPMRVIPEYSVPLNCGEPPPTGMPPRYFLHVGRISRAKGIDSLLGAFAQRLDYPLVVVGEPDGGGPLPAATDNVRFAGRIPREQLGAYYAAAEALVFPSICAETFGLTAAEALSCGTAVIARASGGVQDVVVPEVGALYSDESGLLQELDRFWKDPSLARGLGKAGRERHERCYTPALYLKRYLGAVEEARSGV
jgi:glycosyltransferase involved in cell wall biosynthesis